MNKLLRLLISFILVVSFVVSDATYAFASNEKSFSKLISKIDSNDCINNYFGYIMDNEAIQLANDIKIAYVMNNYKDIDTDKIIASSVYLKNGKSSSEDYVDIRDELYEYNLDEMIDVNKGIYGFKITGKDLKELLEYSASCYAYATPATKEAVSPVTSSSVSTAAAENDDEKYEKPIDEIYAPTHAAVTEDAVKTSSEPEDNEYDYAVDYIDKDWEDMLSAVSIYDGIGYTVDTTVPARYNPDGSIHSDSERIKEYSLNGKKIESDDVFTLVTDSYPELSLFDELLDDKIFHDDPSSYRNFSISYAEKVAEMDNTFSKPDFNYNILFNPDVKYSITTGKYSEDIIDDYKWIKETKKDNKGYINYICDFSDEELNDTSGPLLVAVTGDIKEKTNQEYVFVKASDFSGISSLLYVTGKYSEKSSVWNSATKLKNGFKVSSNSVYSILATDNKGNSTVKYIKITNIDSNFIEKPNVSPYYNTSSVITGTAIAEGTIGIETENYIYRTTSDASGYFSYKLPAFEAGKTLYVFAEDSKGNISERTVVNVLRNGPNKPSVNAINSNSLNVSGNINDDYAYPMLLVNNKELFIMSGNTEEFYKKSSLYSQSYTVKPVNVTFEDDGTYTFKLSHTLLSTDTAVLYTIDILGRISSPVTAKINAKKPVKPTVNAQTVTNKSKKVTVYENEPCTVYIKVNGKTYSQTKSTYDTKLEKYVFKVSIPRTDSGVKLKIWGKNSISKSAVLSIKKTEYVPDKPVITYAVSGKKVIKGKVHIIGKSKATVKNTKTKVYVYVGSKKYKAKVYKSGEYRAKTKTLKKGKKITVQAENLNGKSLKATKKI